MTVYDWLNENAAVELLPVDWVNDPRVIGRESEFVSVYASTEVDLFGQCASETAGGRYWSSSDGQADFARGRCTGRAVKPSWYYDRSPRRTRPHHQPTQ
jgi:acyl-CoA hydrolase